MVKIQEASLKARVWWVGVKGDIFSLHHQATMYNVRRKFHQSEEKREGGERRREKEGIAKLSGLRVRVRVCTLGCERKRRDVCADAGGVYRMGRKKGGIFLVCLVCLRSLSSSLLTGPQSQHRERERQYSGAIP